MADPKIVDIASAGAVAEIPTKRVAGHPDKSAMRVQLVDKATEVIPDIPMLINMVSKRVRQLNNGRSPLITVVERMGNADIALTEIIEGKIVIDEEAGEE